VNPRSFPGDKKLIFKKMVKSAFFYEKIIIFQREKAISLIFP